MTPQTDCTIINIMCGCGKVPGDKTKVANFLDLLRVEGIDLSGHCQTCLDSMYHDLQSEYGRFIRLDPGQPEYQLAYDRFNSVTCNKRNVIRIEKHVNINLFHQFKAAYKEGKAVKLLFHGTQHCNNDNILENGFDISRSKDGLLGYGVYFAEDSSYSCSYTERLLVNGKHVRYMLLCRVQMDNLVTGDRIYCLKNDRQCYPEYIIYYEEGIV